MPSGITGSALLHVMLMIFFFGYIGQAWNISGGFAGQLSLGHAAFFGLGAYTSSLLYVNFGISPWIGMIAGMGVAGAFGLLIGLVSFHYGLRGPFFALVTIAFAEILRLLIQHLPFTGGPLGILIPLTGESWWEFQFLNKEPYYYITLCMMLASIAIVWATANSRWGFYFRAIREDEDAAEAIGIDITRYKLISVALSAALTGAAGTFYAQYTQYIVPDDLITVAFSVEIVLRAIIGGAGTVMGPIVGSFIMTPLGEATRIIFEGGGAGISLVSLLKQDIPPGEKFAQYLDYLAAGGGGGLAIMLYGAVLIVVCIGMPRGVVPWLQRRFGRYA
jgi:branched-chain amino acid transport system permease protein